MTNVTMKAGDTLHISEVGQHNILAGQEFVVSSTTAKELEDMGRATRVGDAPDQAPEPDSKEGPPVLNKMEDPPANKGARKAKA